MTKMSAKKQQVACIGEKPCKHFKHFNPQTYKTPSHEFHFISLVFRFGKSLGDGAANFFILAGSVFYQI